MAQKKKFNVSNMKKTILGIAIAIILALFIGYGINVFYKAPGWNDYCQESNPKAYENKEICEETGGNWNEYQTDAVKPTMLESGQYLCTKGSERDGEFTFNCITNEEQRNEGWCDTNYYCMEDYNNAREIYNRNVFFISVIAGLLFLVVSAIYIKENIVGSGLMGGAVITMIYGSIRYWGDMQDSLRFILLGIVLAVLIWMGYKKFSK